MSTAMSTAAATRTHAVLLALAALTAVAVVKTNGALGAALAPGVVALAAVAVVRLPLRITAIGAFATLLLFHNPGARPMGGVWRGPLVPLGEVLFNNLRLILQIDFLRFAAIEVLLFGLVLVALLRALSPGDRTRFPHYSGPLPLRAALVISFCALLFMLAFGVARGGDFRQALWQTRQLAWVPILGGLFMLAFRTPKTYRAVGFVVVAVATLRSLEGLYFHFFIERARGLELPYIITHEDSVLFCVSLAVLGCAFVERPSRRVVWTCIFIAPILLLAMLLNQRRLVYVSLCGSVAAIWFLLRLPVRRQLKKLGLFALPVLALYVAAGWNSTAPVFSPVASLRSLDDDTDTSNEGRDDENYNLIETLRKSPFLGTGFGHPYEEVRRSYSIARFMENYLYIPHNSVLGLWAFSGLLGFTLLWLPMPLAVFFAVRAYRRTRDPTERVAALACISAVIAYMAQAYGDMGVIGWMGSALLSAAYGIAGSLAMRTGAWPRSTTSLPGPFEQR